MHFCRNNKDETERQSYLILEKEEWNRLKKQSQPQDKPVDVQKAYVKSLTEKSRAWTKTWPDHDDGRVASYEKKQRKQREANAAFIKKEQQKKKFKIQHKSAEAIKQAKERIFADSCYGKKLMSAFRESKTLEERDAQVQFLKQLKEEKVIESKKFKIDPCCSFGLDKQAMNEEKYKRSTRIQVALQNKEMQVKYERQKKDAAKAKEAKKKEELDNNQLTKEMLVKEKQAEEKVKLLESEALKQFMDDHKKALEMRAMSEAEYHNKVLKCHKEKEELNKKINRVLREMYKIKDPWTKKVYENLTQIQEEERKLNDLKMENNIKLGERRFSKRERKAKEKEKQDLEKRLLIAETNKIMAECVDRIRKDKNKLSDRQCIIVKSDIDRKKKKEIDKEVTEKPIQHGLPVFGPCNKLMSALKKRMQQPPCWTGASAAHQQFARHADDLLRDCKYKNPGRKVVDEYIKYNRLESLDIPNYY